MPELENNRENADSAKDSVGVDAGVDVGADVGVGAETGAGDSAGVAAGDSAGVGAETGAGDSAGAMPVAGLGVDIIEIERMERALARTPRIRERIFSENERNYAQGKLRPGAHFALFFAAKEAVFKALGTGFAGMAFTDVEVDHDRFGRPVPILHGRAKELAHKQGIVELQLSLSYTHTVGVASVVAIKEQDRPRKETKADPKTELLRQFKEVRAILDDMDERLLELDESLQRTMDNAPSEKRGETPLETLDEELDDAMDDAMDDALDDALDDAMDDATDDTTGETMGETMNKTMGRAIGETMGKTLFDTLDDRSPHE